MLDTLLAFVAVSAVVICTPGQDTALTIRNTLTGGRRSGIATAGGVAAGQAVWTVAASAGVVALLTASEPVFRALKLVGAAYLVYLGVALPRRRTPWPPATIPCNDQLQGPSRTASTLTAARALRQGVAEQPRQPEDGGLLREPAAAVRPGGDASFAVLLTLGLPLLHDDLRVADRLRGCRLEPRPATHGDGAARARRGHRSGARSALGLRLATEEQPS